MTTNKILVTPGTPTLFQDTTGDVTFTLKDAVDINNGQVSNQWDRSAGSLPIRYKWEATIKWVATPTLGDVVRLYLYAAQKANSAVDLTGDGDVTPETKFGNFALIGQVICTIANDQAFYASGIVEIYGRYVNLGVWNGSATKDLNATSNACSITFTPMSDDIQAAA
jgi:hypothetical protein